VGETFDRRIVVIDRFVDAAAGPREEFRKFDCFETFFDVIYHLDVIA